jgi:hypothetical protein
MQMALASLLGKHKQSFLYDTWHCADGSYDADPVEIHRQIQTHYRKHFSADPESLIQRLNLDLPEFGSAAQWEVFVDDPEAMAEAFLNPPDDLCPTAVPAEFVRAIARAFQRTPAAVALEAALTLSLASPLSFKEFIYSLNGGGSSAPGESGTTYRLLQIAPEAIQREIFAHLQEFWTAATILQTSEREFSLFLSRKI